MPNRKTLTVLIICIAIVVSVWLLVKIPANTNDGAMNTSSSTVRSYRETIPTTNDDWKKMLVSVDSTTQNDVVNLTTKDPSVFDETLLTAQMARDFFSQYLLLKKGGRTLTQSEINNIVNNIMSSPEYSQTDEKVYKEINLHLTDSRDVYTLKKYKETLNLSLKTRSLQISDSPVTIFNNLIKTGDQSELEKLDPIITIGKGLISDLLGMQVPSIALEMHLNLLNATNNILSDAENLREIYTDPIRGFVGISKYNKHIIDFQTSLKNTQAYFEKMGI